MSTPLTTFLLGVLTDHGNLSVFALDERADSHKVEIIWDEEDRVAVLSIVVECIPDFPREKLKSCSVSMFKVFDVW